MLARPPEPPYADVIFTSQRTPEHKADHAMAKLAPQQPGFRGADSGSAGSLGISLACDRVRIATVEREYGFSRGGT
jgi:hypothetical protein